MADGYGVGYGVGQGLHGLAEGLRARFQNQYNEREKQADAYETQAREISANIAKMGGKDAPGAGPLVQQLQDIVQKHNALYPHHETPALIARIKKFVGAKPGQPTPDPRAGMTAEGEMAAAPVQTNALIDDMRNFIQAAQQANPGMSREAAMQEWWKEFQVKGGTVARASNAAYKPQFKLYKSPDGSRQDWYDINDPDNPPPDGWTAVGGPAPKAEPKPIRAFTKVNGKITSVLIDPKTNKPIAGSENPDILPPAGMTERITTGFYHWVDENGQVHETQETRTSGPAGSSATPKTPGELKDGAKPKDTILGNKGTAATVDADKKYADAVKLNSLAENTLKHHSATNDKLLAGALIRSTEGRFNATQYDNLTRKAGLANTFEQWLNNAQSGELTGELRQQLVDAAKANLKAAKDARDSLKQPKAEEDPAGLFK